MTSYTMPDTRQIPAEYAGKDYHVEWMSNYVTPGSYVTCVPAQINNFNCFYVNPLEHWSVLEQFMMLFHDAYNKTKLENESIPPHHRCLTKGLYVAVQYTTPGSKKGWEYHRALILKVKKRKIYRVFLIDFGDIIYVTFKAIRLLKREFLDRFPAQAIECQMHLSSAYDKYVKRDVLWEEQVISEFRVKVWEKILGIDFIETSNEKTFSKVGKRWSVFVSVIKDKAKDLAEVEREHLERWVIERVHGHYIDTDKESDLQDEESLITPKDKKSFRSDNASQPQSNYSQFKYEDKKPHSSSNPPNEFAKEKIPSDKNSLEQFQSSTVNTLPNVVPVPVTIEHWEISSSIDVEAEDMTPVVSNDDIVSDDSLDCVD